MISQKRIKQAHNNFSHYLNEGLLKKQANNTAKEMYLSNAQLSLKVAEKLINDELKPFLWVIVCSYYSMFYMANAFLLHLGFKTSDAIVHKVTSDALIVLALDKLKKELIDEYEDTRDAALEISAVKAEAIIQNYDYERAKRSRFQYEMPNSVKQAKAVTSLKRAKEFLFEMRKLVMT